MCDSADVVPASPPLSVECVPKSNCVCVFMSVCSVTWSSVCLVWRIWRSARVCADVLEGSPVGGGRSPALTPAAHSVVECKYSQGGKVQHKHCTADGHSHENDTRLGGWTSNPRAMESFWVASPVTRTTWSKDFNQCLIRFSFAKWDGVNEKKKKTYIIYNNI